MTVLDEHRRPSAASPEGRLRAVLHHALATDLPNRAEAESTGCRRFIPSVGTTIAVDCQN